MGNAFFSDQQANPLGDLNETGAWKNYPTTKTPEFNGQVIGDPAKACDRPDNISYEIVTKSGLAVTNLSVLDVPIKLASPRKKIWLSGFSDGASYNPGAVLVFIHFNPTGISPGPGFTPSGKEPWLLLKDSGTTYAQCGIEFCKPVQNFFLSFVAIPGAGPVNFSIFASDDVSELFNSSF